MYGLRMFCRENVENSIYALWWAVSVCKVNAGQVRQFWGRESRVDEVARLTKIFPNLSTRCLKEMQTLGGSLDGAVERGLLAECEFIDSSLQVYHLEWNWISQPSTDGCAFWCHKCIGRDGMDLRVGWGLEHLTELIIHKKTFHSLKTLKFENDTTGVSFYEEGGRK